jgi:hypothetical protein
MPEPRNQPALALGLSFLFAGLAYSIPLRLPEPGGQWTGRFAPEILTLYSVVSWMGLAHFVYAYRGQALALHRRSSVNLGYWLSIGLIAGVLALLLHLLGPWLFSGLAWTYFIGHFVKAEAVFSGTTQRPLSAYFLPVAAFAWFSAVLFNVGDVQGNRWIIVFISALLVAVVLLPANRRDLMEGRAGSPLLSLFLIGESLVWGTYGTWMTPFFRTGLYVFHVAVASFYHYFGSYAFAFARSRGDRWLTLGAIVGLNTTLIAIGLTAASISSLNFLKPIFGIEYFTLWVALHLVSSDLFPKFRKMIR